MARTAEGKVKDAVKKVLKPYIDSGEMRAWWPVPSGYGESTVDCHGVFRGFAFCIETKAEGKELKALQRKFMREHTKAGGCSFIVTGAEEGEPYGLEPLRVWLERMSFNCPNKPGLLVGEIE